MDQARHRFAFNTLLGIAFYLPLEDFVLSWLPFPLPVITAIRQAPEVVVWVIALWATAAHLMERGTIRVIGQRADRFLLAFIVLAMAGMAINDANVFVASISLKALLRYIPLVYALIMLAPTHEQLGRIPRVILLAFVVQFAVGMVEWLGGQPARGFFSVVNVWGGFSFVGVPLETLAQLERHDVNGTIARPVAYAYFMLVGLVVWLVRYQDRPAVYILGALMALLATFHSHSRMAVLTVFGLVLMHQVAVYGLRRTLWLSLMLVPLAGALALSIGPSIAGDFYVLDVFSREYQEHALNQRLGLVVYLLPNAFDGGIAMLGHSSDVNVVASAVAEHFELTPILAQVFTAIVEDVYWLALLLYYGFVGFACFVVFFGKVTALVLRLFRRQEDGSARQYALVAALLLLVTIPLNAVNQTFEVRQFSYYLWLFIGVAIVAARNQVAQSGEIAQDEA